MSADPYKYFMIEAAELLDSLNRDILKLEKEPGDASLLKALFRYAHTLKGAAHVVGLLRIGKLSHSIENLFSKVRDQAYKLTAEDVSLILETLELIKNIIEVVKAGGPEDSIDIAGILEKFDGSYVPPDADMDTGKADKGSASACTKGDGVIPNPESQGLKSEDEGESRFTGKEEEISDKQPSPPDSDSVAKTNTRQRTKSNEAVRVLVSDLESLMDHAGELITGNIRMEQLHACFRDLTVSCKKMLIDHRRIISFFNGMAKSGFNDGNQFKEFSALLQRIDMKTLHTGLVEHTAELDANLEELKHVSDSLYRVIHRARSIRISDISHYFKRAARDLSIKLNKKLKIIITGDEIELDRNLIEEIKEPVNQIIRNAAVHGIEDESERLSRGKDQEGIIKLDFNKRGDFIYITCEDDGRGIRAEKIKEIAKKKGVIDEKRAGEISREEGLYLIFDSRVSSGETVTEFAGRGVGLDIVKDKVESLGGDITIETEAGKFTRFLLKLPLSLNIIDAFLVETSEQRFLIPLNMTLEIGYVLRDEIEYLAGKKVVRLGDSPVSFRWMSEALGLDRKDRKQKQIPFILLKSGRDIVVFAVDHLLGIHRIIIKYPGEQLKNLGHILGGAILSGGCPSLVLNVANLFKTSLAEGGEFGSKGALTEATPPVTPHILAVDDSLSARMLIGGVLEPEGYEVTLAGSGEEGLSLMKENKYDLFTIDVEMPGMNGFELTKKIRGDSNHKDTPVIILSSLSSDEHRRKGIKAGAQAYMVKGEFDQGIFLKTIKRLV